MHNSMKFMVATATVAALAACGGGGGGDTPVAPTTTSVPITVLDGPAATTLVCVDANSNGVCDTSETKAPTDANGKVTLDVPNADVGKYPVIATADPAQNLPAASNYTLSAPADATAVISPLTTLVQQLVANSGISTADAVKVVQASASLTTSPLANYSGDATTALTARLLAAAIKTQTAALVAGSSVPVADVQKAVLARIGELVPSAATAAAQIVQAGTCNDATSNACKDVVATQSADLVAGSALTTSNLAAAVVGDKLSLTPSGPQTPGVASFILDWVNAVDTSNWYYRVFTSTAAENTPDAAGLVRSRSIRHQSVAGVETIWSNNPNPARQGDLHWNGSAWVGCLVTTQTTGTVRDAQGRSSYNGCDGASMGNSQRSTAAIDGQPMSEVFATIRSLRSEPTWGVPGDVSGTSFPAGSSLIVIKDVTTANAIAYDVRSQNVVTVGNADVALGGDAIADPSLACNSSVLSNQSSPAVTLETLIGRNPGKPCVLPQGSIVGAGNTVYPSLPLNEGWGNTTVSMGTLGTAPLGTSATATSYFTTNTRLRVSFAGGSSNAVTYHRCLERVINGSTRNCTTIGTGTYTIATLGDARVMTFANLPGQFAALDFERVFVERSGEVYFGYQSKPSTGTIVRLNAVAGNAVLTRLGIPTFTP